MFQVIEAFIYTAIITYLIAILYAYRNYQRNKKNNEEDIISNHQDISAPCDVQHQTGPFTPQSLIRYLGQNN